MRIWGLVLLFPLLAAAADVNDVVANAAKVYLAAPATRTLSIGVVEHGRMHSYHYASLGQPAPDDQTIYPIASLTKTFAGALLAQAALEHKLQLDDDVRLYLGAGYDNLAFEGQPIRLYHLLNHRSGLPFDNQVDLHSVRLSAPPGTRFQYSNAAANLLGDILARTYGSSFDQLVRQRIAAPLGMQDTFAKPGAGQGSRVAAGYDDNGVRQSGADAGFQAAGGLKSSLPDMLRYARWQLNESDAVVRLSHQPTYASDDYAVGLNWQMLTKGAQRVLWQDGAIPGYASLVALHPQQGVAVVVLTNQLDRSTLGRLRVLVNGIAHALSADSLDVP